MKAEIQRIPEPAGCLRLWTNPAHGHGDPYQFTATVRWIDETSIELMGVTDSLTAAMLPAIKAAAAQVGATRIAVTRIKPDRQFTRWHRGQSARTVADV